MCMRVDFVIPSPATALHADDDAFITRPSPGPSTRFARSGPPSPRKRGEGQLVRASKFVALLPACGEKVAGGRMRGVSLEAGEASPVSAGVACDFSPPWGRLSLKRVAASGRLPSTLGGV